MILHPARVFLLLTGLSLSLATWMLTVGNRFNPFSVIVWCSSIIVCTIGLSTVSLKDYWALIRSIHFVRLRPNRITALLALIMLVGAGFRFADLGNLPGEMTRDQAENIVDAQAVLAGITPVYFPANTGREPFQMYAGALLAVFLNRAPDFFTFKLLSALESWLTIPVVWWMGREMVGERERQLGNWLGLLASALVAVSYWHVAITRLGLRLALLPLVTALVVIWLVRALRYNRRSDYLWTGLALGFSLYTYQAARILPLLVLISVIGQMLWGQDRRLTLLNLVALIIVSLVVFTPLFGYWLEHPAEFWQRVSGRFVGEAFESTTADFQPQLEALGINLGNFGTNLVRTALMFHGHGDVTWVSNIPGQPALDPVTGWLFLIGLIAWPIYSQRQRNPIGWLVLITLVVMLIPSALALATPAEVPSATRASGALPVVYFLAACPAALAAHTLTHRLSTWRGKAAIGVGITILIVGAGAYNANLYFNLYRQHYRQTQVPYSLVARTIRPQVAESSINNLFLIADPRAWNNLTLAVQMEASTWINSVYPADTLPDIIQEAAYRSDSHRLDIHRPLLFIYVAADQATEQWLQTWFPEGERLPALSDYAAARFMVYRVAPLEESGLARFIEAAKIKNG